MRQILPKNPLIHLYPGVSTVVVNLLAGRLSGFQFMLGG